jgi:hypothetical protein
MPLPTERWRLVGASVLCRRTYDAEQAAADSPPEMPAEIARIAKGSVALLVVGIMLGALLVPTVLIETIYGITVLTIDGAYWCSAVGS